MSHRPVFFVSLVWLALVALTVAALIVAIVNGNDKAMVSVGGWLGVLVGAGAAGWFLSRRRPRG